MARVEEFRALVARTEAPYELHYLVLRVREESDGDMMLTVVHDTTSASTRTVTMKNCRTYLVVSGARTLLSGEGVTSRFVVVHGKTSQVDLQAADRLLRLVLRRCQGEAVPTLNCRDRRMAKRYVCEFGVQAPVARPATRAAPLGYRWRKEDARPTEGRELVSKALYESIRRRASILRPELLLEERVMRRALPISLKHRWIPVHKVMDGTPLPRCDTLLAYLRSHNAIPNEEVWRTCLIEEPLFETHYARDRDVYYIPAPADLEVGDYVRVDADYYVYAGGPHATDDAREDRRYLYVPAFSWSGEDCETGTLLAAVARL